MPLYEYECTKCHKRTEKIETVAGPHLKKCPHCGGKVERLLAPPAIQFKGAGWYVTDYAAKKSGSDSGGGEAKEGSKEAPAKESATKDATQKETKDKKPAKK